MNNLGDSLLFFEKILTSEIGSKVLVQDVFKKVIGVTIPVESIKKGEFSLYIESHPVIKNEIALHKEELFREIYRITGQKIDSIS